MYTTSMALENEVQKLMDDAIRRNPMVLEVLTGVRSGGAKVSADEEFDVLLDICAGIRQAVLRLAREIDEPGVG